MTITKSGKDIEFIKEWQKCRSNILYFALNYVVIPETGGSLRYDKNVMHTKIKRVLRSLIRYKRVNLLASRQLGKSTVAAVALTWVSLFYPGTRPLIVNMRQDSAIKNLETIKFIIDNLPSFMQVPYKDKKLSIELDNGSVIKVFYPTAAGSGQVGRSLTSSVIYIDEAAHIRDIQNGWAAAQPVLSRARQQAIKNNYPYFILITSTPNGSIGDAQWFFDMWSLGIDSDLIFDNNESIVPNYKKIIEDDTKNGFINVRFHWSEDPDRDEAWYKEQCKELNFNQRTINQELDLLFVGGTSCVFTDEYLGSLKSQKHIRTEQMPHSTYLNIYKEFNINDYYVLGIDTAKSLTGDYCVIEVFQYSIFEQVAEFYSRLGSVSKFNDVIESVIKYLESQVGDRILLAIENNSVGNQVVEYFIEHPRYSKYVYSPDVKKDGIQTNMKTKDVMISILFNYISDSPELIHSPALINQLSVIEKKHNGSVGAQSGQHDDLFMGCCLAAYVKKSSALEIDHLINVNREEVQQRTFNLFDNLIIDNQLPATVDFGKMFDTNEVSELIPHTTSREYSGEQEDDIDGMPLIM